MVRNRTTDVLGDFFLEKGKMCNNDGGRAFKFERVPYKPKCQLPAPPTSPDPDPPPRHRHCQTPRPRRLAASRRRRRGREPTVGSCHPCHHQKKLSKQTLLPPQHPACCGPPTNPHLKRLGSKGRQVGKKTWAQKRVFGVVGWMARSTWITLAR